MNKNIRRIKPSTIDIKKVNQLEEWKKEVYDNLDFQGIKREFPEIEGFILFLDKLTVLMNSSFLEIYLLLDIVKKEVYND